MLEADKVTTIYKSARSKIPYYTCIILQENLNKMDYEPASLKTHDNMQSVIRDGQEKNHSVHYTKNTLRKYWLLFKLFEINYELIINFFLEI